MLPLALFRALNFHTRKIVRKSFEFNVAYWNLLIKKIILKH